MFQIELNVNGLVLSIVQIVNKKCIDEEQGIYLYEVEFYRSGSGYLKFTIKHRRNDGSEVLVLKAFQSLLRRKQYKIWLQKWNEEARRREQSKYQQFAQLAN